MERRIVDEVVEFSCDLGDGTTLMKNLFDSGASSDKGILVELLKRYRQETKERHETA
jgi:hypothetical protein